MTLLSILWIMLVDASTVLSLEAKWSCWDLRASLTEASWRAPRCENMLWPLRLRSASSYRSWFSDWFFMGAFSGLVCMG